MLTIKILFTINSLKKKKPISSKHYLHFIPLKKNNNNNNNKIQDIGENRP